MRIYGDRASGNCLKVRYTAERLGLPFEWADVDVTRGETRTPEFLALNPMGQVPVVAFEDGRVLAQSNAIIRYLAHGTPLLPQDPFLAAKVDELMFWEQYSHEPYVAVCRFHMHYLGLPAEDRDPMRVERGEKALDLMELLIGERDWYVGDHITVADIALLAYTRLAHEGGFDLAGRPAVRRWIGRCEQELGLQPALASAA